MGWVALLSFSYGLQRYCGVMTVGPLLTQAEQGLSNGIGAMVGKHSLPPLKKGGGGTRRIISRCTASGGALRRIPMVFPGCSVTTQYFLLVLDLSKPGLQPYEVIDC